MKWFVFTMGLAAIGFLAACRDDDGLSDPFYIATVTPTPTPVASPTPTPFPGVTPTPTATPDAVPTTGAAMTSATEQVTVTNYYTNSFDSSVTINVQRVNGEIWALTVVSSPTLTLTETLTYQSADLVFGSTDGRLFFPNGVPQSVDSSVRLQ